MIGYKEWLDLSEAQVAKAGAGGIFKPYIQIETERIAKIEAAGEEDQPSDEAGPFHIHLKGARYLDNGLVPTTDVDGFLWRGRISQVSAWSLGELGPPS